MAIASQSPPQPERSINQVFPRSVLSASRAEFGEPDANPNAQQPPLQLHIEGALPHDLQGHVFIVGPVGSVDSKKLDEFTVKPSDDGTTPLYNGDGMIYRLDFNRLESGVFLSTRLIKAPCYYADAATQKPSQALALNAVEKSPDLKFSNMGITRISQHLGARNQLNTAFLPMKFAGDKCDRLLVTWDAGRPYEIDPYTLETVTPVGWNDEWREVTPLTQLTFQPPQPFKLVQTSAHPCFDSNGDGEMFTVNCGRSISTVLAQLIPIGYIIKELFDWIKSFFQAKLGQPDVILVELPGAKPPETFKDKIIKLLRSIERFIRAFLGLLFDNFVYLICWDGKGQLKKWQVLHRGFPIKIKQSLHQMGLTEKYVILMDTAFKISIEELLPTLHNQKSTEIEKAVRNFLDRPQLKDNAIYIIKREDLRPDVRTVQAKKITIPGESAHFLVDYKNPNDEITLHLSQVCAWDAAEWISKLDFDLLGLSSALPLYGVIFGPMDISKFGTYVVNGDTGEWIRKKQDILSDVDYTWGPALYTYRSDPMPDRIEDIYWSCLGCWQELLLPHIIRLYKDYKYRQIGVDLIEEIAKKGKNASLVRVHIADLDQVKEDQNRLDIADGYLFENGYTVASPQFVPRGDEGSSTDGYIVCIVHYGQGQEQTNGNEIWIFNAACLSQGPVCRLWHPQLNIGFTVHSTWLPKAERRTASYHIPIREDYQKVVQQQSQLIQDLFEDWVYPQKEP